MLLLDSLLLAPGKGMMAIFEELARKAIEECLDDGPIKQELQDIYALLESGNLSEMDFATRENQLLQRLEQIARARFSLPGAGMLTAGSTQPSEVEVPAPTPLQFPIIDVPAIELPSLELPEWPLPATELPRFELPHIETAHGEPPTFELPDIELPRQEGSHVGVPRVERPHIEVPRVERPPLVAAASAQPASAPLQPPAVVNVAPVTADPVATAAAPPPAAPPVRMNPAQVVQSALSGLAMLKMKVSAVTAVTRVANGWQVIAELIESRAVPDTSDLLGVYEVQLDESGNILGYERTRMRRRCDLGDRR